MIPTWLVQPLLFLLVVGAFLGGIEVFSEHERSAGAASVTAAYEAKTLKAVQLAQATAAKEAQDAEIAHQRDLVRATDRAAADAAARAQLVRLRARLPAASAPAASGAAASSPGVDAATVYSGLFGECIERYVTVAAEAGQLADQVIGLQGYILAAIGIEGGGSISAGESPRGAYTPVPTQPAPAPLELTPGDGGPPK